MTIVVGKYIYFMNNLIVYIFNIMDSGNIHSFIHTHINLVRSMILV